jgi:hypothetical protein
MKIIGKYTCCYVLAGKRTGIYRIGKICGKPAVGYTYNGGDVDGTRAYLCVDHAHIGWIPPVVFFKDKEL